MRYYMFCLVFLISCQSEIKNHETKEFEETQSIEAVTNQVLEQYFIASHKQDWESINERDLRELKQFSEVYRIHIDSSFSKYSYLIRFMKTNSNEYYIVYKEYLDYAKDLFINDSIIYFKKYQITQNGWDSLIGNIEDIGFWNLKTDTIVHYDGFMYEIEGYKTVNDHFHFVSRNLDTKTDFAVACLSVLDLVLLKEEKNQ